MPLLRSFFPSNLKKLFCGKSTVDDGFHSASELLNTIIHAVASDGDYRFSDVHQITFNPIGKLIQRSAPFIPSPCSAQ